MLRKLSGSVTRTLQGTSRVLLSGFGMVCLIIFAVTIVVAQSRINQIGAQSLPTQTPDANTATSRGESAVESPTNLGERTTVEGTIFGVLESYPLVLQIRNGDTREYYVALSPDTQITQDGKKLDMGQLIGGMYVQVEGIVTATSGIKALIIKVVR